MFPETHGKTDDIKNAESKLDVDKLVDDAVKSAKVIEIKG